MRKLIVVMAGVALLASACGGGDGKYSREDAAAATADNALALFKASAEAAESVAVEVSQLCENPSGDRVAALNALHNARQAWRRSEVFWFGPVMGDFANSKVDSMVRPDDIDAVLNGDTPATLDEKTLQAFGSDTRGFGALEFVLDRPSLDGRPCAFLVAASEVARDSQQSIETEWATKYMGGAGFASQLKKDPKKALDEVVNNILETTNLVSGREIGIALGELGTTKKVDPTIFQEGPQGWSTDDLKARLEGIEIALFGHDDEDGIAPLLTASLRDRVRAEFDAADGAVDALNSPLRLVLAQNPAALSDVRKKLVEFEKTVATEVVLRLGVTVGFSDGDGDSAG